ncbi:MAG: glycosyltransferase family 4 protein [Pleurocapsa sp.]
MKIAFVNQPWTLAVPIKGCDSLGIWTYQVARRLIQRNHQVVVYGRRHHDYPAIYRQEDIEFHGISRNLDLWLRSFRILDSWRLTSPTNPFFASAIYSFGYITQVAKDLQKQRCDVIHIQNFSQFVPIIKHFNPDSKVVLHSHCEWLSQLNPKVMEKRIAKADLTIGCSEYISDRIRQKFPHLKNRCQTVYNGVDTELFAPAANGQNSPKVEEKTILYVGRISPEKGLHLLIDAFVKVTEKEPQIKLIIAGEKSIVAPEFLIRLDSRQEVKNLIRFYQQKQDYLEYIKQQIPDRIKDRVHFTGGLDQAQLVDLYRQADILVNPSLSESFGMSLIEAMAVTTPVIGTKVGGMVEVIADEKAGCLVDAENSDALANKIMQLISNPDLVTAMGLAGRQRVLELFSWEQVTESLLAQYQKLLTASNN